MLKFGVKKIGLMGLLLITALTLISCGGTTSVDDGVEEGYYMIVSVATNMCIDNANNSSIDKIWMYEKNDSPAQKWIFKRDGNFYKITSEWDKKVMDATTSDGIAKDGCVIIRYDNNDTPAQRWKIEKLDDGYYRICSKLTSKYVSIKDFSVNPETPIVQYGWSGNNAQKWQLIKCK